MTALALGIPIGFVSAEKQRLFDGRLVAGFAQVEPLEAEDFGDRGADVAIDRMAIVFAGPTRITARGLFDVLVQRFLPL